MQCKLDMSVRNYSKLFIMKDMCMYLLNITGIINTISIQTSGFKQISKPLSISAKPFEAVSRITNNVRRMDTPVFSKSICVKKALFTSFLFTSANFYSTLMLTAIPHLGWNQSWMRNGITWQRQTTSIWRLTKKWACNVTCKETAWHCAERWWTHTEKLRMFSVL